MKVLMSACLAGVNCRYDDTSKDIDLRIKYPGTEFVLVCPEVLGGLSTPRASAEISNGKVINIEGVDVTSAFLEGADAGLKKALKNGCSVAILKARSPSCGNGSTYDGSFSGTLIAGDGIFATALKENNIKVFSEENLNEFEKWLQKCSS